MRHATGTTIATALGLLALAVPAFAFDSGPHWNLTRDALALEGFGPASISVAQVENWMVDYFSDTPLPQYRTLRRELAVAHFDDLADAAAVAARWDRFTSRTQSAVGSAARDADPERVLALLGMSLHSVQDFYSHSNWVELHPVAPSALSVDLGAGPSARVACDTTSYRTTTWFDEPGRSALAGLRTGAWPNRGAKQHLATDHGDAAYGMNHDSNARPDFDRAYVFAFFASLQWSEAVRAWAEAARPGIWARVQDLRPAPEDQRMLERDQQAAYRLSHALGHWNGPASRSLSDLAGAAGWTVGPHSRWYAHVATDGWHRALYDSLRISVRSGETPAVPVTARRNLKLVTLRTLSVSEVHRGIDPLGAPDFFATVTIGGFQYREPALMNQRAPADAARGLWRTMRFVPETLATAVVRVSLRDEDGGLRGADERCPIDGTGDLERTVSLAPRSVTALVTSGSGRSAAHLAAVVETRGLLDAVPLPPASRPR